MDSILLFSIVLKTAPKQGELEGCTGNTQATAKHRHFFVLSANTLENQRGAAPEWAIRLTKHDRCQAHQFA
jgi:hypothetical protein